MLSSIKSRRILHFISVTLAILVFGYGLFLKLTKEQTAQNHGQKVEQELVKYDQKSVLKKKENLEVSAPN